LTLGRVNAGDQAYRFECDIEIAPGAGETRFHNFTFKAL
jgi:hypothetical protein